MTRNGRYRARRPKRTRFQATGLTYKSTGKPWNDGTASFLAYGIEDAQKRLGYNGLVWETLEPFKRAVHQGSTHTLIPEAVAEAKAVLGLTLPVRIRYSSRAGNTRGNYRLSQDVPDGNYHNIMLKSYLDPEQASRTLWHELAHAMQAEREAAAQGYDPDDVFALDAWRTAPARGRGIGYLNKPIEIEAREHEQYHEALALAS